MKPNAMRSGAPSMADVAARAGVSHQTVSRVLNSPDLVRPNTRERVEVAIQELGYRRNITARALRTRRTDLIGVVSPGDAYFGPSRMTIAIEEAAREKGYATALSIVKDARASTIDKILSFFLDHHVDGIIVIAPVEGIAETAKQLAGKLPVVLVAAGLSSAPGLQVVGVDQELGARLATRYLLDLGHHRIVHVAGPTDWFDARERVNGWRRELGGDRAGAGPVISGGWDARDGYRVAQQLLRERERPSAVFAANDYMALGLIRAFQEAGLRVPEDISVVGFDDVDASDFFGPPLTTVRQPFAQVGHAAIDALLRALSGDAAAPTSVPPELVVRESATRA